MVPWPKNLTHRSQRESGEPATAPGRLGRTGESAPLLSDLHFAQSSSLLNSCQYCYYFNCHTDPHKGEEAKKPFITQNSEEHLAGKVGLTLSEGHRKGRVLSKRQMAQSLPSLLLSSSTSPAPSVNFSHYRACSAKSSHTWPCKGTPLSTPNDRERDTSSLEACGVLPPPKKNLLNTTSAPVLLLAGKAVEVNGKQLEKRSSAL